MPRHTISMAMPFRTGGAHSVLCEQAGWTGSNPYPLRLAATRWLQHSAWYKLGNSLSSSFKTACRAAEGNLEPPVGGGIQWFHWYGDTTPITDQYNRAIGMSGLGPGVLGQCFWITGNSWHPYQYNARVGRNVHELTWWYMRFQSDMSKPSRSLLGHGRLCQLHGPRERRNARVWSHHPSDASRSLGCQ